VEGVETDSLGGESPVFQTVTRNELTSPFIFGVSSGAELMILLTLVVFTVTAAFLPLVAADGSAIAFLTSPSTPRRTGRPRQTGAGGRHFFDRLQLKR